MSRRTQDDFERAVEHRLGGHALAMDLDAFQCSWLLHEAAIASRRRLEHEALREFSLGWTQFELLWHLWLFEEEEMRHVAEAIAISKGSLTETVTGLAARGLVRRRTSDQDRRSVLISITEAGSDLVMAAIPRVNAVEGDITAGMNIAAKRTLAEMLRGILSASRRSARSSMAPVPSTSILPQARG